MNLPIPLITLGVGLPLAVVAGFVANERRRLRSIQSLNEQLQRGLRERADIEKRYCLLLDSMKAELREAKKLDELGRLVGRIAHDFNSFLTTIMANCQTARMDLVHGHPAVESIDHINEASKRAAALVRQILCLSRNQGQERQVLFLEPVVRDALKLLHSVLPQNIGIQTRYDANCPAVLANVEQIHQIILNLGTNALHAMRAGGGSLMVILEPTAVDETLAATTPGLHPGSYVRLTVTDSGHGMDRPTLECIFDPFFTTKPQGEGTGLGLSIVHDIVRHHHGAITVSSEPNKGTVFQLYFPAVAGQEDRPGSASVNVGKGRHVLLVDTDAATAESGQHLLETLGYRATVCATAATALELLRQAPEEVACIIGELSASDLNGLELAVRCRRLKPDVPFVLTSAHPTVLSVHSLRAFGICEFMLKPFSTQLLEQTLQRALTSGRQ